MADLSEHEYKKLLGFKQRKAHLKKNHKNNNLSLIGGGDHDYTH
jgi:hypothetical protein